MLSVIVPIGGFPNGIKPFKTWINSAGENQIEIILVADFDDPKLMEEISLVAKNCGMKIRIFPSSARNPGGSRNIGISNATGDWICFWDADDHPNLDNMLKMVSESEKENFEMLVGIYHLIQQIGLNDFEDKGAHMAQKELDLYCDPGIWRIAFRRDFIGKNRFKDLRMGEDQQFIFGLLNNRPNISFSQHHVYRYVKYQASQLTKSPVAINDLLLAMKECMSMYQYKNSTKLLVGIYKQSLTLFKGAGLKSKTLTFISILKFWAQNPRTMIELPYCLLVILKYR